MSTFKHHRVCLTAPFYFLNASVTYFFHNLKNKDIVVGHKRNILHHGLDLGLTLLLFPHMIFFRRNFILSVRHFVRIKWESLLVKRIQSKSALRCHLTFRNYTLNLVASQFKKIHYFLVEIRVFLDGIKLLCLWLKDSKIVPNILW